MVFCGALRLDIRADAHRGQLHLRIRGVCGRACRHHTLPCPLELQTASGCDVSWRVRTRLRCVEGYSGLGCACASSTGLRQIMDNMGRRIPGALRSEEHTSEL